MQSRRQMVRWGGLVILAVGGVLAVAQAQQGKAEEQERKVKEAEVPAAALGALKKLAGSATLTEFSEEIEHGHKFYEGSWQGPDGNVDALVTEAGDIVEIEEIIPIDKAPPAVRAESEKQAGKDAKVVMEKKTKIMYEAKFKKGDQWHELVLTPDGREQEHEEQSGEAHDD